jgi:hypothetical protein
MSVTLFHCPKCGSYSTSAMVNLVVSATLRPKQGRLWPHDVSYPEDGVPLEDVVESYCEDCGSMTELMILDECPHQWGISYSDVRRRICAFCGETQQGRLVFDE